MNYIFPNKTNHQHDMSNRSPKIIVWRGAIGRITRVDNATWGIKPLEIVSQCEGTPQVLSLSSIQYSAPEKEKTQKNQQET